MAMVDMAPSAKSRRELCYFAGATLLATPFALLYICLIGTKRSVDRIPEKPADCAGGEHAYCQ
jgi:hypothetical protein